MPPKNAYCNRGQGDRFERLGLSVLLSVCKLFSRCFPLVLMPRDILLVQEPLGVRQQVVLAIAPVPLKTPFPQPVEARSAPVMLRTQTQYITQKIKVT